MTDLNHIRIIEGADMGRRISVYRLYPDTDILTAFGYSAYRICRAVPDVGRAVYSSKLEMPYLELTPEDVRAFFPAGDGASDGEGASAGEGGCMVMPTGTDVVDILDYEDWIAHLDVDGVRYAANPVLDSGFTVKDGMSVAGRSVKRFLDIAASAFALVALSPLLLALGVAVKVEDGGTVIYRQRRVGRLGREFTMLKFRSLKRESVELGPTLSLPDSGDDPRISRCGLFMRKHHLDELPQLWNVLRGDMSVIGPRPERMFFVRQLCAMDADYFNLFQIRPGLVSGAYLKHGYADTPDKMLERARTDLEILPERFLWDDIRTVFRVLRKIFV